MLEHKNISHACCFDAFFPVGVVLNVHEPNGIRGVSIQSCTKSERKLIFSDLLKFFTAIKCYLTIRLRAWDFYEAIVDEGEARINYHLVEIESE